MTTRILIASLALITLAPAVALMAQTSMPTPPVRPGLWETKMSELDANGKEVPSAAFAALAGMPPEQRAAMAAAMRARGVQMPDENGVVRVCLSKESLDGGAWEQMAASSGCTTTYATRSNTNWKWHSSCAAMKIESDGETVFTGGEAYRTKVTSTSGMRSPAMTSTRVVQGKWLGAACGDIKPLTPPTGRGR